MNIINKENYKVPVFSWCPEIGELAWQEDIACSIIEIYEINNKTNQTKIF